MKAGPVVFSTLAVLAAAVGFYALGPWSDDGAGSAQPVRAERVVSVEVETAKLDTVRDRVTAVGTTRAIQAVDIVPLVSGRVEEIAFEPGERVTAGKMLVRLNDATARAQEQEASAELEKAKLTYDRAQSLMRTSASISQATVDEHRAAYLVAKARHEAAVDALAERSIDAPFAGTVGLKDVDIGDRVSEGTLLTTLDDLSTIEIEFSVPELYYGAIKRGMSVSVRTLAFGRQRFRGSISQIDTRIDPVTRSFRIIADVPNESQEIPAGMFMNVRVTLNEREAIVISQDALVARGEETFVYIVKNGIARERPVELGIRRRLTVEIADGLEAGDEVVVKGIQNLRDGAAVRVVTSAPDDQATPASAGGS